MIPLGIMSRPHGGSGGGPPALVQFKTLGNVNHTSLTLDTPPTPGNLLVIACGSSGEPTEFSHGATMDILFTQSGWRTAIASAVVAPGAPSLVSVTGMSTNAPRLAVWEFSGVKHIVNGTATSGSTNATSTSDMNIAGNPALVVSYIHFGNNVSGLSTEQLETDSAAFGRFYAGHSLTPTSPVVVTWSSITPHSAVTVGFGDGNPAYLPNSVWNVSGSSLGTVSDPISSWGTFSQVDTAKQPTVGESGSFKYAAFDGSDYLPHPTGHGLNTSQTMFAVVRVPTAVARSVIGVSTGTGVHLGFTATLQARMAAHGGDFASANTTATASTGQWCVISGRYTYGSSLESRLNAGTISAVPTTTATTLDRSNALGGNAGAARPAMDIAEAWNFRRALTNSEWDGVVSYLMTKYGIGA